MTEVKGLQELFTRMEALPHTLRKIIIARALRKGVEPIRARMEDLAPVAAIDGGELKASITTVVSDQSSEGAYARVGPSRKGFYGLHQEFGTVHHRPQPFMRPAFDEKVGEATELIGQVLAEEITKALKKL